ncbi:hypothetical protein Tco_0815275 [Tanacetum coccineum]
MKLPGLSSGLERLNFGIELIPGAATYLYGSDRMAPVEFNLRAEREGISRMLFVRVMASTSFVMALRQKKLYAMFSKASLVTAKSRSLVILYLTDRHQDGVHQGWKLSPNAPRPTTVTGADEKGEKFVWRMSVRGGVLRNCKWRLVYCSDIDFSIGSGGFQIYSDASKKGFGLCFEQHGIGDRLRLKAAEALLKEIIQPMILSLACRGVYVIVFILISILKI